jgi:hypothetical protein
VVDSEEDLAVEDFLVVALVVIGSLVFSHQCSGLELLLISLN